MKKFIYVFLSFILVLTSLISCEFSNSKNENAEDKFADLITYCRENAQQFSGVDGTYNEYGEQIICCPNCYSYVAIGSNGGFVGYSRIIKQEKELLDMMMPIIKYLKSDFEISCTKYNNDQKHSEMLGLCFKNEFGDKCNVFILNIHDKIQMKIDSEEYEKLDMQKLIIKVTEILI